MKPFSIVGCGLVFLFCFAAAIAAQPIDFIYVGHDLVDYALDVDADPAGGPAYWIDCCPGCRTNTWTKVEVYRDDELLFTLPEAKLTSRQIRYHLSDETVLRDQLHAYQRRDYIRNECTGGQWAQTNPSFPTQTVDTSRCSGELFNDGTFPRDPVRWSGSVHVRDVLVSKGVLEVEPGAVVNIENAIRTARSGSLPPPDGSLQAIGATFRRGNTNGLPSFIVLNAEATVRPALSQCALDDIRLFVKDNARNVDLLDNVFAGNSELEINGRNGVCSGTRGIDFLEIRRGADYLVASNLAKTIVVGSSNCVVQGNVCDDLQINGGGSLVGANRAVSLFVGGHGNHIHGNWIDGASHPIGAGISISGNHNDVRSNVVRSAGMGLGGASNVVSANRFEGFIQPVVWTNHSLFVNGGGHLIYDNYFSGWGHSVGGWDYQGPNRWSIDKTPGVNVVGGPYLGGNYWALHAVADADGDGIGDTPHDVPGQAGAQDLLPLVGPGELELQAGPANPVGATVNPAGQPFPVAQIRLRAGNGISQDAAIHSMTFTFQGDTQRLPSVRSAQLYSGASLALHDLTLLAEAPFSGDRVAFALNERIPPGSQRDYAVFYVFHYVDEYAAPPPAAAASEIRFGASIAPEDVSAPPLQVTGSAKPGWVRPLHLRYLSAFMPGSPASSGSAIESSAEVLFAWSLYGDVCANPNPRILRDVGSPDQPWTLWIKNLDAVHALSAFANRPTFRTFDCAGASTENTALPTVEALDSFVDDDGRLFWAPGLAFDDPYANADFLFAGEVDLTVAATRGDYAGFLRDVATPLRNAFGGADNVLVSSYSAEGDGYLAALRILTRQSASRVHAALLPGATVLDMRGRTLSVRYAHSHGGDAMRSPGAFLEVQPQLDFGHVAVGQTAARPLLLRERSGQEPLHVSAILPAGDFRCDWSGTLPAGGQTNVPVFFTPQSPDAQFGFLRIVSDAASGQCETLCVGRGTTLEIDAQYRELHGLPLDGSGDYEDFDGDGFGNWEEWLAGTDPNDPSSHLFVAPGSEGGRLTWPSQAGRLYNVRRSTDLTRAAPFLLLDTVVGEDGQTSFEDRDAPTLPLRIYRVDIQPVE
jgi:hypothetical protein